MTAQRERRQGRRGARLCTAIGGTGLAALAFAYWFTVEPAPSIRVTWREGATLEQQAAAERKYLLSNRRAPHAEQPRSLAYDLLDTRQSNIRAVLDDPAVEDTNDIDDQWARVRLGTATDERWMWAAHRTPWLRQPEIRWTVMLALAAMAAYGLWALLRARGSRSRE